MTDKTKIARYYERDKLTWQEQHAIAQKSNDCCCHCGKKVFFGNIGSNKATVDHFIPLDRGGSNRDINMIMMCEDCNHEKDNKIMGMDYIPYLLEPHKSKLSGYVDSYIQTMDYVQRNRILALNEYNGTVYSQIGNYKKKSKPYPVCRFTLKLATWDDLDKLTAYFIKYLKKYEALDDEDAARENIIFWLKFGCIYYIEKSNNISVMVAITVKNVDESEDYRGIMHIPIFFIFSYYASEISLGFIQYVIEDFPKTILVENNIDFLPLNLFFLRNDNLVKWVSAMYQTRGIEDEGSNFTMFPIVVGSVEGSDEYKTYDEMSPSEKKTYDFTAKFDEVSEKLIYYYEKYADRAEISWMMELLMSYKRIMDNPKLSEIYKKGED